MSSTKPTAIHSKFPVIGNFFNIIICYEYTNRKWHDSDTNLVLSILLFCVFFHARNVVFSSLGKISFSEKSYLEIDVNCHLLSPNHNRNIMLQTKI